MKRFISLFLIFALCLSFASCSAKKDSPDSAESGTEITTLPPPPVIDSAEHSKEFKDENGRVVYTVDVKIPQITEYERENFANYINKLSLEIFNEACEKAESNLESAARFMDARNTDTPWARKIDFEVSLSSERYLSIIIKEYFSTLGEEVEPSLKTLTFDVVNGVPCTLYDFALEVFTPEEVNRIIVDNYICDDVSEFFFGGQELNDEVRQIVHDIFDPESFYLTSDGIGFYLSKYAINPLLTGAFTCEYTWSEIAEILKMPE